MKVASWRTTLYGNALSVLLWWQGIGFKVPNTKQEWATAAGSALISLFSINARDVTASEQAHAEQQVSLEKVEARVEEAKVPVVVQVQTAPPPVQESPIIEVPH